MTTYGKQILSGSTDGRGIKVVATATAGTTIHIAHATATDEIWLYVTNDDASAVDLTLEWGGVTDPDDLIQMSIPSKSGLYLVAPGLPLTNSLVVKAFGGTANVLTIHGFANRITA